MTLDEAIFKYKLDRRTRWFAWGGLVIYNYNYSIPCSGCIEAGEYKAIGLNAKGSGCHECGYSGRRRSSCPVPATHEGKTIQITDADFTNPTPRNLTHA